MNPHDNSQDETRLAALLAAAARDATAPDAAFLERLREQSAAEFQAAASAQMQPSRKGRFMFLTPVRLVAASAAALVLLALGLHYWPVGRGEEVPFDEVLRSVAEARTVHLKYTRLGHRGEVWAEQPGRARYDEADGTYRIALGEKLWQIDERANQATLRDSRFESDFHKVPVDVLGLVLSGKYTLANSGDTVPAARVRSEGKEWLLYRLEARTVDGVIAVDALADPQTHQLHSLEAVARRNGREIPIGALTMLAYDEPIPQEKFAISDTLTNDGRLGKVTDTQGIVGVRPVMHQRWTPARPQMILKPGDLLRTDVRGANAVGVRLVKQTGLILGPGTQVELVKPNQLRVISGELEVAAPGDTTVELIGPNKQSVTVKGTRRYRVEKEKLVQLDKEPLWLQGFKGTTASESLGSLIAKVDGRDVPLTVGTHKVAVDIRDQIARTVIEETFVNHTDAQLEGVFYFPLPQDASISGFGMWIGDKLVEADVVEKQRAREIYETILREKRDPGLLEWSGGNIFKARVFPIFAHSEKRIKITYTQVLPLRGTRYVYSYSLQSEMLRLHPLRELSLDVKVNSVVPLKSVTCPSHPARTEQTNHSGHVEFNAQEYTPARDFEVAVEIDGRQSDVVVIPHRRGDDGYFMLQLTPPAPSGDWQREILPDGQPLELLILADTSASMDSTSRATQAAFLASVLDALTPRDSINLAGCDVDCNWVFEKALPASADNLTRIRQFLESRTSLGWTDLDRTFASALKQCGPRTHVLYVGDGTVTTGDGDPVAFAARLRKLCEGNPGTFHAIASGNSFESVVLKAIGSIGGGSVRRITSERGPQAAALELLNEIAQPGLRNLKVEFKGVRVARVYPDELPNIPAGAQQILLGRYLPQGRDQAGEVIVTGMQGDKPVRFSAPLRLADAEQGNSFIPRLWARQYLDVLLEQGTSDTIKNEIIALSEEYQIITPYTSLLVLESDADRERFKVKRRFQMRDGEKFFAEGRDNANYELTQKQMQKAGNWRLGLRRAALAHLAGLNRNARQLQSGQQINDRSRLSETRLGLVGGEAEGLDVYSLGRRGNLGVLGDDWNDGAESEKKLGEIALPDLAFQDFADRAEKESAAADKPAELLTDADPAAAAPRPEHFGLDESPEFSEGRTPALLALDVEFMPAENGRFLRRSPAYQDERGTFGYFLSGRGLLTKGTSRIHMDSGRGFLQTGVLFPALPSAPMKVREPKSTWPAEAQAIARSLLRSQALSKLTGGLEIGRQTESLDVRWANPTSRSQRLELFSPAAWLTRTSGEDGQTLVNWCDARERGVLSKAFQLGQVRASNPLELATAPFDLDDYSLTSLERSFPHYAVTIHPQGQGRTLLVLSRPAPEKEELRVLVDTARHVVLSVEDRYSGKVLRSTRFEDFVFAAGSWWARRVETLDAAGRVLRRMTQSVKEQSTSELAAKIKHELADREQNLFLHLPLPSLLEAKQALSRSGRLTFEVEFVLLVHFADSQQWTRVLEHLEQAERLAAARPGVRWIRNAVLNISRRHEELKKRWFDEAVRLVKQAAPVGVSRDDYFLAEYLIKQAGRFLEVNETLSLLDVLRPVFERDWTPLHGMKEWRLHRVYSLQQAERGEDARTVLKQLATEYPHDAGLQQRYMQSLVSVGEHDAVQAWLAHVLAKEARWTQSEEEILRNVYTEMLESQGRFADLVAYLAAWIKLNPERERPYSQYLSALIYHNELDKADALTAQWLREGQVSGELPAPVESRLMAAIHFALGQGHNLNTNRILPRWFEPLAQTVLFFARHETRGQISEIIMRIGQFQRSDECRNVRKAIRGILTSELDKLSAEQIARFVDWIWPDDPLVDANVWKQLAAGLRTRWDAETNPEIKNDLARTLIRVLSGRLSVAEHLAFLRLQMQRGPEHFRGWYGQQLFDALLAQPWSAPFEDEAFALLDKLSDADEPAERLRAAVAAIYRLTDSGIVGRNALLSAKLEHAENLTRIELQKRREDDLRLAREGFAERLRQEVSKRKDALVPWLNIERLYLEVRLECYLKQVAADCWAFLATRPAKAAAPEDAKLEEILEAVLHDRYLVTLLNLATRKDAEPAFVARVVQYLDQGIAGHTANDQWKSWKFELLVALDRPKELESALRRWTTDDAGNRWRLALGYLLAEQGRIAEAVKLLETIELTDELGPLAYRALADWYMVQNRRDQHEQAQLALYKTMPEHVLHNLILVKLRPWQLGEGHLPKEVDRDVLLVFAALFEKSDQPQNYLWPLQQYYQASRDFRLLSRLADAVVGHTAGKVYLFLQGMSSLLDEIRDEATADALLEHLTLVRKRAKTTIDRRALDFLELLVERRAAELQNQPGPHRALALAAMKRAFKSEWSPGEQRPVADFLAGLGKITQPALAEEQLRELETLHREQVAGGEDRLHVAHRLAVTLGLYGRAAAAADVLHSALAEFQAGHGGVLPVSANAALTTLLELEQRLNHYVRGEQLIVSQLQHPVNAWQKLWLRQQLYGHYHATLQQGGAVSLGSGQALYRALEAKLRADLSINDQNHRYALVGLLCSVYHTAHDKKYPGVLDDLHAFAFRQAPDILKRQTVNYDSVVGTIAQVVYALGGAREGLAFLLNQIEQEPAWVPMTNSDAWRRHAVSLSQWRREVKTLGDLEPRLLNFVLLELRRDLETREVRDRIMYAKDYRDFWTAKADAFAQAAEEVLAKQSDSGAAVQFIASYLHDGLGRDSRAIAILLGAHKRKLLDETGQIQLVDYLQRAKRFDESIPLLLPWVEIAPEKVEYRTRLMKAYYHTHQQLALRVLLKATDVYFHKGKRWTEGVLRSLGQSTLDNHLFAESIAYYKELIPLHERTASHRGIGDGWLSAYYSNQAEAYSGLHQTALAVDAAAGAIVSWGPRNQNRATALETLKRVLRDARDLDAYAAGLDQQREQSPIVRKAIGQVYFEKAKYAQAIKQLQSAAELQPNDTETYQFLIACYDKQKDAEGAIRQLLQAVQLSRRDIKLYQDLGRRLNALKRPIETERAYTSIVEVLPQESESHTLLAEVREQQNRWPEAVVQWEQVARIRTLEPTGLLKLASAQIHQKQWDAARESLKKLRPTSWPARFTNVAEDARKLERQIEAARNK